MAQLLWRSLPQGTAVCGPDETASYYVRQAPLAGFWIGGCQGADAVDTVGMAPGPATEKLLYRAAPLWTTRFEHVRGAEQQPHDIDADSIGPAKIEVTPFKALRCR